MARQTRDWEMWKRDSGKAPVVGPFAAATQRRWSTDRPAGFPAWKLGRRLVTNLRAAFRTSALERRRCHDEELRLKEARHAPMQLFRPLWTAVRRPHAA